MTSSHYRAMNDQRILAAVRYCGKGVRPTNAKLVAGKRVAGATTRTAKWR